MNKKITLSILALSLTACGTTSPPILEDEAWKSVNNITKDNDNNEMLGTFNGKKCATSRRDEQLLLADTSFKAAAIAFEKANSELDIAAKEIAIASKKNQEAYKKYEKALKITDEKQRNTAIIAAKTKLDYLEGQYKITNNLYNKAVRSFHDARSELKTAQIELEKGSSDNYDSNELKRNDLCKAYSFADFYRREYIKLSSTAYDVGTGLDALGLLASLTGVTAVAFDWHQDALIGSALTLATAMGAKSYTQPSQRSNLYLQGAQRMQCIVNTSPKVLNSSVDYNELVGMKKEVYKSISKINSVSPDVIESAKKTKPTGSLTQEDIEQQINHFLELKKNSLGIRKEITRSISLVESMPDQIILATKEAELKFNNSFVSSAPDFNKSLSIIQGAISQQMLNQQQIQKLEALFPETEALTEIPTNEIPKSGEDPSYTNLSKLVKLSNELLDKRDILLSELVNFSDVNAALKLCNAI
ncbi:hypothetical protein [Vibrio coralliilyticus]|uniref:hypothetical protein n=1 Tax=Vibrio coralliilyticus TaxID=190893 RepID=UPI000C1710B1|nr:hypothetical protein [Vibrio coralliilyticus]